MPCFQVDQGLANAGGVCLQNLWTRKEAWKSHHLHNVLACYHVKHFDAALLFPAKTGQIRDLYLLVFQHVPDPNPGSLAGSHVKDNGGGTL